jgi:hypothetical protein
MSDALDGSPRVDREKLLGAGETELALTVLDDLPWHQAAAPFPLPATSDTHFNDGYYFGFFSRGNYGYFGLRLYPNMNVIDGYGGAIVEGEQRTVRASRALRPSVEDLSVGPLRLTILEPMSRQRLQLLENPTGVTFDVTFTRSAAPFFESPDIHYRQGRLLNHVLRYTQLCRVDGVMFLDGREVAVQQWYADRDHSWGVRASVGQRIPIRGVERTAGDPRAIRIWLPFEVGDHVGFFSLHEDQDGQRLDFDGRLQDADGRESELLGVTHSFRYLSGTRRLTDGEFTLTDADGREHRYEFEVVCEPASAQGFGYVRGWQNGEPPGSWRGADYVEADRFRVDDPHTLAGPDHIPIERRLGACEYPVAIRSSDGQTGMAQIEHMVYRPYRPYGLL